MEWGEEEMESQIRGTTYIHWLTYHNTYWNKQIARDKEMVNTTIQQ